MCCYYAAKHHIPEGAGAGTGPGAVVDGAVVDGEGPGAGGEYTRGACTKSNTTVATTARTLCDAI